MTNPAVCWKHGVGHCTHMDDLSVAIYHLMPGDNGYSVQAEHDAAWVQVLGFGTLYEMQRLHWQIVYEMHCGRLVVPDYSEKATKRSADLAYSP